MNDLEKRFGWRLISISRKMDRGDYENAYEEYSNLVRYFKRINYNGQEKLEFFRKIKGIGDELSLILMKKKLIKGGNSEEGHED